MDAGYDHFPFPCIKLRFFRTSTLQCVGKVVSLIVDIIKSVKN